MIAEIDGRTRLTKNEQGNVLSEKLKDVDRKIELDGVECVPQVVDALIDWSNTAFNVLHDKEVGLRITRKAKSLISDYMQSVLGMSIRDIDQFCRDNSTSLRELDMWWELLLNESPYWFESYIDYMEKDREFEKKFYAPRKKTLGIVVNDMQILDDSPTQKFYGLSMPSRVGKALAYNTPVLTRNGWKKHGDLTIHDEVIGADGEFKKIIAIHNPCKMEYKVTFSDGESVICHGNHEWVVHNRHNNKVVTIETKKMAKRLRDLDGHYIYTMPTPTVVEGSHRALWVDPYTLGAWLGDGRNQNPDICNPECDYAIIQKILDAGYEISWHTRHKTTGVDYYGIKGLREQLQKYGMCHSRKTVPKYIPEEYLVADEEQRLELLAGLLDTDGSLRIKENRYDFSTTEPMLKDGMVALVNSFGWRTCVVREEPKVSSSGIHGKKPVYVVSFNPTFHIPCQVERKQLNIFSKQRRIGIESIEPINEPINGNCITVEGGTYRVGKTLKVTHNSTICIFFLTWVAMKKPNSHTAMGGHSGTLVKGFYKELLNFIVSEEYTFAKLYGHCNPNRMLLRDKSAEDFTITLDRPDRFATLTCRGIDATWTGAVDVSKDGYLYVDDLVRDRQHSLSPTRMEETYQEYLNKMVDRKNDGAKELMIGTLWNVLDPLERIRVQYQDDPRYVFRRIPALDENDHSNFDYEVNGFSSQYYIEMRERLDPAEWQAKFQQRPFVREGLLFPADELIYFNGLVEEDTRRVIAVCDPAFGGGDRLSMPICLETVSGKKKIIDWIYSKETQKVTIPKMADAIAKYHITTLRIEKNNGGALLADNLKAELKARNYIACKVETKSAPNGMPKEEKIKAYSDYIKDNFEFLPPKSTMDGVETDMPIYKRSDEYQLAVEDTNMYTAEGKNVHDDAPDSLSQLAMFFENGMNGTVEVIQNPFSGGYK